MTTSPRFSQRGYLTLENRRETEIVADGGEYGGINGQGYGRHCRAWTAFEENIDEFAGKVLAIRCAAVATDQYFAAVAHVSTMTRAAVTMAGGQESAVIRFISPLASKWVRICSVA
jgi:hypothetical protein